ncbi:MAG: isoleucine--tRNA ligase [Patescibacteria group bacterium]|nr:isoleucine--tRNA ligase [Patescibacteria group bacterium]
MTQENNKEKSNKSVYSQMEEDALKFWADAKIFEKSVEKEAPHGDYVFYDGPPFITGLPHYATLLPSITKDVVPRYWTMKGYRVERKWGWDCHGLPAENKVEKELGLKNKKDIETLGVDKFVDACRAYVNNVSEQWNWYINRIARWVDMDHAYRTMDLKFMESVMWAFKELHSKGLIYEGYRSSLHCPRCATPLSKFEITMDAGSYKDVTDNTVVIKFKVIGEENTYLLAWTTTPWTLPGNLALAVGEEIKYKKLKTKNNEFVILASDRVEEILKGVEYEVVEELSGKDLIGLGYEPLFNLNNEKINNDKTFKVYHADYVSTEDGTGIVHIAPNFGEEDFDLGKNVGLPTVELMDENGAYTSEAGEFAGIYYKKAGDAVMEKLGDKLFSEFKYTHSYPFCYRCGTPLIYKTQKAWYLDTDKVRARMLATNEAINWVPEFFKEGRFKYNLENAPHWCLSRSRYWGSPIPVWRCEKCGEIKVTGSIKEIEELSGEKITDLHRPNIDKPEFACACGGKMKRVKEVLDCWFESGSMPYAQEHYPIENKEKFEKNFPADFIIEYTGQLRGWFYYLHVLSNSLFNSNCFKNVIVTGVLAGTDGRKMSKSYGNYPDPRETLDRFGGDALRMYFMSSPLMVGGDMAMNEKDLEEVMRKNIIVLWNVYKFYEMFAGDGVVVEMHGNTSLPESENILDQWILVRLSQLIKEITEAMEKYNMPEASRPITAFIDDLSTWYIRRSRDRFKSDDEKDKQAAIETTSYVLLTLSKVIAIFMPFMAENLWQRLTGNNFKDENKSVHLESWPTAHNMENITHNKLLEEMVVVRKIVELGLAKRDEAGIKVRQPLQELRIKNYELRMEYLELVKDELNIKEIKCEKGNGEIAVELNTEISEELKLEGVKREIVRFVNALRKDAGLSIQDRVEIYWQSDGAGVKEAFELFKDEILKDTLSVSLTQGEGGENKKEVNVNGEKCILGIKRV